MVLLHSIRRFFESLVWIEAGAMSADIVEVIGVLETNPDARWLVAESRRSIALVKFWRERMVYTQRTIERQIVCSADRLDPDIRKELTTQGRLLRNSTVRSRLAAHPEHGRLLGTSDQYEAVIGALDGLLLAMDTPLIVQEAVSNRKQEEYDNSV